MTGLDEKISAVRARLKTLGRVAVAFSGGVDSTLLLKLAQQELGQEALAVTAALRSVPERELRQLGDFCCREGIALVQCDIDELSLPEFAENGPERCYFCKKKIMTELKNAAAAHGIETLAEGSNTDDLADYRPGRRALSQLGIISPLLEQGISKAEVRQAAKQLGLEVWSKPAYACLASRIPMGQEITAQKLSMVEGGEELLHSCGFQQVRLRLHEGGLARIEVPTEDIERLTALPLRQELFGRLREMGFRFVSVDMGGYKTGNMNESTPAL